MMEHSVQRPSASDTLVITLEQGLFALIFAAALFLRLWNLNTIPLQSAESVTALQSWSMYRGLPAAIQQSPLLVYLNFLVFLTIGASDASARALPAVAGSVLVLLPYFGRRYVGSVTAIIAALLLAFSPTLTFFSRYVGEGTLVAALSLGLVFCALSYARKRNWTLPYYASALILGLLLASGLMGYLNASIFVLFVFGVVGLKKTAWGKRQDILSAFPDFSRLWPVGPEARNWFLLFSAAIVVAVTGGLTNLHGLQEGTAGLLFSAVPSGSKGTTPAYYAQLAMTYETIVVVFAFVDVFYSPRRKSLFDWFLIWWAAASLLFISVLPEKSAVLIVQPLVPMVFLAAELAEHLLRWLLRERSWISLGALALVCLPPLFLLLFVLSRFTLPGETVPKEFAAAPVFVLLLAFVGSAYWRGIRYASNLWGTLWFALLFALMLHTTANLNFRPVQNPAEPLVTSVTEADVRNLVADVDRVLAGAGREESNETIVVDRAYRAPLGWYLRNYDVRYVSTAAQNALLVVASSDANLPSNNYAMQRYTIGASAPLKTTDFGAFWRWLVYRETRGTVKYRDVVLYVKI